MARSHSVARFLALSTHYCLCEDILQRLLEPYPGLIDGLELRTREKCIDRHRLRVLWAGDPDLFPSRLHTTFATIDDLSGIENPMVLVHAVQSLGTTCLKGHTIADLAALLVMADPQRAVELAVLHRQVRRTSVRVFYADAAAPPAIPSGVEQRVGSFREVLAAESAQQLRTRCVTTIVSGSHQRLMVHVLRGDYLKRTSAIDPETQLRTCVPHHPEVCDSLVYDSRTGQLRVRAQRAEDIPGYLAHLGHHVFGNLSVFPTQYTPSVFRLDAALRLSSGFAVGAVPGVREVYATAVACRPRGARGRPWRVAAPDGFYGGGSSIGDIMPSGAIPCGLDLRMRLSSGRVRSVRIEVPNLLLLADDDDGDVVIRWLLASGIMKGAKEAMGGCTRRIWDAA